MLLNLTPYFTQHYETTHFNENSGYRGYKVYSIVEDSKKNLWIATELGVYKFNGYTFKEVLNSNIFGFEVFDLLCDSEDKIWLGTFSPYLSYINSNEKLIIADSTKISGALRFIESIDKRAIFFLWRQKGNKLSY